MLLGQNLPQSERSGRPINLAGKNRGHRWKKTEDLPGAAAFPFLSHEMATDVGKFIIGRWRRRRIGQSNLQQSAMSTTFGRGQIQFRSNTAAINCFACNFQSKSDYCNRMADEIHLSSSDEGSDGGEKGFLAEGEKKALADELDMAEEMMGELDGSGGGKADGGGQKKKNSTKKGGAVRNSRKPSEEKLKKAKQTTKTKKENAKGKPKKKGAAEESEAANSDENSSDPDVPKSNRKMSKKEEKKAKEKAKLAKTFGWIKNGHIPGGFHQFGQCSDCSDLQKSLDEVVVQDSSGLFTRVIQCNACNKANQKIRQIQNKLANGAGGTEKTPAGEFEFVSETDDYKAATLVYVRQLGQCGYCSKKQLKMPEMVEKIGKANVAIKIAQCSLCVFLNKSLQRLQWDGFSTWKKGGGKGNKKKSNKRKAQISSGSESSESGDSDDDDEDDEPKKKKAKKQVKKKGGKKKGKKSIESEESSSDEDDE